LLDIGLTTSKVLLRPQWPLPLTMHATGQGKKSPLAMPLIALPWKESTGTIKASESSPSFTAISIVLFCKLDFYSIARHVACTAADHVTPATAECRPVPTGFCSPHSVSEPKTLLKEDRP
jgi:hypothetical protein